MKKNNKYKPLDAMEYPRFEGIRTFMRLPHETNLKEIDFKGSFEDKLFIANSLIGLTRYKWNGYKKNMVALPCPDRAAKWL